MAESVFIVSGRTGEYSDGRDWFVAAYLDRALAETHATLANAWCREQGVAYSDLGRSLEIATQQDALMESNPYDPDFQVAYTGTDYTVAEVPLLSAVPNHVVSDARGSDG